MPRNYCNAICLLFAIAAICAPLPAGDAPHIPPIPVATITHPGPVDFEKEILPFFSTSCLACHNKAKPKAGLVLETPADIRKGGDDGPVIKPGKGAESLLVLAPAHVPEVDAPMPPPNNKVAAADLTPAQLGLIKLWIDQGATGEVHKAAVPLKWQPISASLASILAVSISPDGRFVACGRANRIDVYDLPANKLAAQLADPQLGSYAHRGMVESLAFSPDGATLASGSFREVKFWHFSADGEKIAVGQKPATCAAASPDGKLIAMASDDGVIHLWDSENAKPAGEFAANSPGILSLQFSADSAKLLGVAKDKSLTVWDVAGNHASNKIDSKAAVRSAAWIGAKTIATGSDDGAVTIYAMPELTAGKTIKDNHSAVAAIAALPSDETHVLVAREDGCVYRIGISSGSKRLVVKHGSPITSLALRADGKKLVTVGVDNVGRLWNVEDGKLISELHGDPLLADRANKASRAAAQTKKELAFRKSRADASQERVKTALARVQKAKDAIAPAEKELAAARAKDDATKATRTALERGPALRREAAIKDLEKADEDLKKAADVKAADDGELKLASSAADDYAAKVTTANATVIAAQDRLKHLEEEAALAEKAAGQSSKPIRSAVFSPSGALIATTSDDGAVRTWNGDKGTPGQVWDAGQLPLTAVTFVGADRVVACPAAAAPSMLKPTSAWKLVRTLGNSDSASIFADRVTSLDFSPDGRLLVTGGGVPTRSGEIRIFDVSTGEQKQAFDDVHSDTVLCVRFGPDGAHLASAGADRFVRITDLNTGKIVRSLEGHAGHALAVAWSRDGHALVSGGADNTLRFWDADTGERGKVVAGFDKEVTSVAWLGDEDQAIAASGEGKVRQIRADGGDVRSYPAGGAFIYSAVVTPDGATLAAGGQDGILRVWNASTGAPIATFNPSPEIPMNGSR